MDNGSINHSINLSPSLQAVHDNVSKHWYATSRQDPTCVAAPSIDYRGFVQPHGACRKSHSNMYVGLYT